MLFLALWPVETRCYEKRIAGGPEQEGILTSKPTKQILWGEMQAAAIDQAGYL